MIGYFGSVTKKTFSSSDSERKLDFWSAESSEHIFRLEGANSCTATLERNGVKMLSLGLMRREGKPFQKDQSIVLGEILDEYEKTGNFNVSGIDGSFAVLLANPKSDQFFLFRNVVGGNFAYYTQTENGLFFGNKLADVARKSGQTLKCDESQLPLFFVFRFVPESSTLFKNIYRIHPGELLVWNRGKTQIQRIQTVSDFLEPHCTNEPESVERLEATMTEVFRDWFERYPNTAGLLSGGVDSTYLQMKWNQVWKSSHLSSEKPKSVCVALDHPHTKMDLEYTMSAVEECGTQHWSITQPILNADFMRMVTAYCGEMPNHVQSFYFWTLGQGMREYGIDAGLSGEGADGLFGSDGPVNIQHAIRSQKKYPSHLLRSLLSFVGNVIKPENCTSKALLLANHLDDISWAHHPLNSTQAISTIPVLEKVFSKDQLNEVLAFRSNRIGASGVPDDIHHFQRTNLSGFFFEGVNSQAYWSQMLLSHDVMLFSPFMDSRILRVAFNIDVDVRFAPPTTKPILRKALTRHVSEEFVKRPKLSFGQPIFEWLSPGGSLRQAVEQIADYPFMPKKVKRQILEKPDWMLWNFLCFDIWYKEFID